jgi:DNA-binding transcriptional regulator LsrR (DeoR family)
MARSPLHRVQAALAARRFFMAQRTKSQIAEEMGLSRFKVARLIDAAVEEGIIEFKINEPDDLNTELADAVRRAFGLKAALVLEGSAVPASLVTEPLGALAAQYLEETLVDGQVLGIAWGRTLAAAARALTRLPKVDVVQANGTPAEVAFAQNPVEIVHSVARRGGGKAYPIYGPMWADDTTLIDRLRAEPTVAAALALYDRIDVLVTGIGAWPSESGLAHGFPGPWREAALAESVTADVCATLVDGAGRVVASPLDRNGICIGTDQLQRIPEVVGVAGGTEKIGAIRSVLRGGWISVLITDAGVARGLLRR